MPISIEELIEIHPQLFHMAEVGNWPCILQHGLLPTSVLLDLFEIDDADRQHIETANRRTKVKLEHEVHGAIKIRDQIPMTDSALQKCLVGMTPEEWYRLLNGRVFFWANDVRLSRLLNARAYRSDEHCIITIDSASFFESYWDIIELSPINSGSTLFKPQPRGRSTFLPITEFPFEYWRKKRPRRNVVVEVTVPGGVPNIFAYVVKVQRVRANETLATIYER